MYWILVEKKTHILKITRIEILADAKGANLEILA